MQTEPDNSVSTSLDESEFLVTYQLLNCILFSPLFSDGGQVKILTFVRQLDNNDTY